MKQHRGVVHDGRPKRSAAEYLANEGLAYLERSSPAFRKLIESFDALGELGAFFRAMLLLDVAWAPVYMFDVVRYAIEQGRSIQPIIAPWSEASKSVYRALQLAQLVSTHVVELRHVEFNEMTHAVVRLIEQTENLPQEPGLAESRQALLAALRSICAEIPSPVPAHAEDGSIRFLQKHFDLRFEILAASGCVHDDLRGLTTWLHYANKGLAAAEPKVRARVLHRIGSRRDDRSEPRFRQGDIVRATATSLRRMTGGPQPALEALDKSAAQRAMESIGRITRQGKRRQRAAGGGRKFESMPYLIALNIAHWHRVSWRFAAAALFEAGRFPKATSWANAYDKIEQLERRRRAHQALMDQSIMHDS